MSLIYIMRGRSLVSERGLGVETASLLLQSLGGASNIQDIEPCMLRIRIEVKSPEKVDDMGLRLPEVLAVVRSGHVIQIVRSRGWKDRLADASPVSAARCVCWHTKIGLTCSSLAHKIEGHCCISEGTLWQVRR